MLVKITNMPINPNSLGSSNLARTIDIIVWTIWRLRRSDTDQTMLLMVFCLMVDMFALYHFWASITYETIPPVRMNSLHQKNICSSQISTSLQAVSNYSEKFTSMIYVVRQLFRQHHQRKTPKHFDTKIVIDSIK